MAQFNGISKAALGLPNAQGTLVRSEDLTDAIQDYRPRFRGTRRSFSSTRHPRYGRPSSDFPPSRLVKYSPKHQYSRLLNFPYVGAHFQPRMNTIVVQIQGISRFNDTSNSASSAAIGVYYGPGCRRNAYYPLPFPLKQTANRAVLEAIRCTLRTIMAMRQVELHPAWKEIIIMTDSEYAKFSLSKWVWEWQKNNWHRINGTKAIENMDVMRELHGMIISIETSLNMSVRFWKVGREDIAGADELAKTALASRAILTL